MFYDVYSMSVTGQRQLSKKELLQAIHLTEEQYENQLADALEKHMTYLKSSWGYAGGHYEAWLSQTLSQENRKAAMPFVNGDGELCAVCHIYFAAGGSDYYELLNLETGVVCTWFQNG